MPNVKSWIKMPVALASHIQMNARVLLLGLCFYSAIFPSAFSKPILNPDDPIGFFTTIADKMLRSSFSFGVTNIPVYSNGVFVYTPSAQRLLQLSANIYDASTTNFYPTVFRPIFEQDNLGNIFIIGYTNLSSLSGLNTVSDSSDLQLASPYDVTALLSFPPNTPIADASGLVNVYGVPWIIGAKKGLPNFNEFSMEGIVQVTRKLQLTRTANGSTYTLTGTNQNYIIGITNYFGAEFWNSYSNAYTNNVQIVVRDKLSITLTNNAGFVGQATYLVPPLFPSPPPFVVTRWPGWTNNNQSSYANSFILPLGASGTNFSILPTAIYRSSTGKFDFINAGFENYPPAPLSQFGLIMTNRLQVFMLEGNHLIDYAQFSGPESYRNLNAELADPDYTNLPAYLWSTNLAGSVPCGIINQINVSAGIANLVAPTDGGSWANPPGLPPALQGKPGAIQAYFQGFLVPDGSYSVNGKLYFNTNLVMQTPYTPTRMMVEYVSWQANDPLVHSLVSDLNYSGFESASSTALETGITTTNWSAQNPPILPDLGHLNERYQP